MSSEVFNILAAVLAAGSTVVATLIKAWAARPRRAIAVNSAPIYLANERVERDPLQGARDRLEDAKLALERQKAVARTNRWTSGLLTFGQYVIGGLLASSFVQQSLSKELVGALGVLVLVSSLIYQHFRPDIQLRGSLGRAFRLQTLIRQAEDDLYAMESQSPNAPSVDQFRRTISTALSEIESSELQDISIRKDGKTSDAGRGTPNQAIQRTAGRSDV
jgi:hypothetical protein